MNVQRLKKRTALIFQEIIIEVSWNQSCISRMSKCTRTNYEKVQTKEQFIRLKHLL